MFNLIPSSYKIIAFFVGALALAGTSYYYGHNHAKTAADLKYDKILREAENQVADLRQQLSVAEGKVVTVYVDKIIKVKEIEYVYINKSKNVPSKCELSNGWVSLHDSAATGSEPDSTGVADASSSGIKDNQALETVVSNYSTCQRNAEQLKSLQEWVRENNKILEGNNK